MVEKVRPSKPMLRFLALALVVAVAIGACQTTYQSSSLTSPKPITAPSSPLETSPPPETQADLDKQTTTGPVRFKVEVVATGLNTPWDIESIPDGKMLILERSGRIQVIRNQQLAPYPVDLPDLAVQGQGGLMDAAPHPNYQQNRWVYISYTAATQGRMHTRVARYRDAGTGLVLDRVIFDADPMDSTKHFGGRIGFGGDRKLYITLGERGNWDLAQDLGNVNGKVLRLNDDGTIPPDNPFSNRTNARREIFSYGNRNIQGMAFQPGSNLIWVAEHGPSGNDRRGGGDEINIIDPGKNYGWPVIHHDLTAPGMESPLVQFTPATAPGGAAFYTGDRLPQWRGNLFVANLRGQSLQRFVINGRTISRVETLLNGDYGRLRAVATGPDGNLYVSTSNGDGYGAGNPGEDRILRISPQ